MNASPSGATIFALATPAGRGAVAIIRLSGPACSAALTGLSGRDLPPPRRASLRKLRTPNGELVDEALVLWMPAPASFTGEDSVELHLHGGRAVVSAVSDLLLDAGLRMAEPGEFTRRAFEHGRLDLLQAEAIADLVEAESGAQRRQALGQLNGALSVRYEAWRSALLDALALLEAEIDFPEEDLPEAIGAAVRPGLIAVMKEMQVAVGDLRGEQVRDGFRIAIIGAPNVGKSSLLNALTGRDAAIVNEIAGTTRDVVEIPISLAGQTIVLADTAGLRGSEDVVEAEGVRRGEAWAVSADLRIAVVDLTRPKTLESVSASMQDQDILVLNKADKVAGKSALLEGGPRSGIRASAASGEVQLVQAAIGKWLEGNAGGLEVPAVTRRRHRQLLQEAIDHLARALEDLPLGAELGGEGVRMAVRTLERIVGRSDPEGVLDRVFASFCIGK